MGRKLVSGNFSNKNELMTHKIPNITKGTDGYVAWPYKKMKEKI